MSNLVKIMLLIVTLLVRILSVVSKENHDGKETHTKQTDKSKVKTIVKHQNIKFSQQSHSTGNI